MRDGIPKWPAYTYEKKEFMAINKYWSVKNDYSLVIIDSSEGNYSYSNFFTFWYVLKKKTVLHDYGG